MSAARLGMRRALSTVPSTSRMSWTASRGIASLKGSIPYTRNTARNRVLVPGAARPRTVSTLVAQPEQPEDETALEGGPPTVNLTERAAEKIRAVSEADNDPNMALRVIVEPGGCHGYMYKLEIVSGHEKDDLYVCWLTPSVFDDQGARMVVDSFSLGLVKGSTIDYVTELIGSQFSIKDNPQAKGSGCGCGVSWEPVL